MAIHVALLDWLIAARPTVADQALHEHNNVSYQQHIAIVDAIRRHDPDEADRALQSHLNNVSTRHAFGQTTNKRNNATLVKRNRIISFLYGVLLN